MPSGNGARAAQRRERQAKADANAGHVTTTEDRKKHQAAAAAHICKVCMQSFSNTVRLPELQQHVESKHAKLGKNVADCFPTFDGTTAAAA